MPFPTAHALLIGVGSYANAPQMNAPITAADAEAVATVLRDPQFCGYPPAQVTLLADAAARRDGILAALDGLAAQTDANSTVLIFYAGHGEYGDDGYYLTSHDTQMQAKKVVVGSGVRMGELIAKLQAIKAKRMLLIVNACHAGELSPVLGADDAPPNGVPLPSPLAAALLGTGAGRVIITACRDDQVSFIGPGPLTLFTQTLVDGLRGKGVSSTHGYISVFNLYEHLYFKLDEIVARKVSPVVRQKYGEKQEPELTILKGVGPFAVALFRGAEALGDFESTDKPPEATAVREVNPAYARAMERQHQQQIGGAAHVGAAVAGDVHGDVNVSQHDSSGQRGGVHFGSGGQFGDITIGDIAGRDSIRTGDISGSSGVAIGRGARSTVRTIDTGGGDYSERDINKPQINTGGDYAQGDINKPQGNTASGDQYTMAGNLISGSNVNINSTLTNASQSIGAAAHGDAATQAQLQALIAQLNAELQKVPAEQAGGAEAVAEMTQATLEQAAKAQPNKTLVQISTEGLKQAAQSLATVLPTVLPIATQIAETVRRMIGG